MCGNLYLIKEVHMEGGKHLDHNIVVALCTDSFNIYRESLKVSSLHCFFFTHTHIGQYNPDSSVD